MWACYSNDENHFPEHREIEAVDSMQNKHQCEAKLVKTILKTQNKIWLHSRSYSFMTLQFDEVHFCNAF